MSGQFSVLVIQDHKENRKKCTLTPLIGRPGVSFVRPSPLPREPSTLPVSRGVLLLLDAPYLSADDAAFLEDDGPLILVDATWARMPRVLRRMSVADSSSVAIRTLPPGITTAYPRMSKLYKDPPAGLASIEALFAASVIFGHPCPEWLSDYRWADEFLRRNDWAKIALDRRTEAEATASRK
jgi:pre-rRNA-processing protein TSR3